MRPTRQSLTRAQPSRPVVLAQAPAGQRVRLLARRRPPPGFRLQTEANPRLDVDRAAPEEGQGRPDRFNAESFQSPNNAFTGSAEKVLTRNRVTEAHEKHHAYCNLIVGIDQRFGTCGSGDGGSRRGPAHRSTTYLSLVPRPAVGWGLGQQLGLGPLPRRPLLRRRRPRPGPLAQRGLRRPLAT